MTAPNENALAGGTAQGAGNAGFAGLQRNRTTPPACPKPGTARAEILAAFLAGDHMTHEDARKRFGASRLAADVHALRRKGWPIVGAEVQVPTRAGRLAVVTSYRLAGRARGEGHGQ